MEELSKQLSTQLNETIYIEKVNFNTYILTDKNNKIKIEFISINIIPSTEYLISTYKVSSELINEINKNNNDNFNIELFYTFCGNKKDYIRTKIKIENICIFKEYNTELNNDIFFPKINEYLMINNKIKLKYGNNYLIKFTGTYSIEIDNISNECIDLVDFIPHKIDKIICDGKIKELYKTQFKNIEIVNCENLKKINNYVEYDSKNNISILSIRNCPNLEFIEYYEKFRIFIDGKEINSIKSNDFINIKKEIYEIKSLLKDQQEYAHIIQSLLKRINKLENKAVENE
jgi:hypothetical protein